MNGRRLLDKLDDFARGMSLAGFVALSAVAVLPEVGTLLSTGELARSSPAMEARPSEVSSRTAQLREAPSRLAKLDRGETLGDLLRDVGVPTAEISEVIRASGPHLNPRQLQPGFTVAAFGDAAAVTRLELELAGKGELTLHREAAVWRGDFRAYRRDVRPRSVRGTLEGSLERSLVGAGAEAELGYAMAEVLQWDLDFARDLQNGDEFEALYEEIFLDGDYAGIGRVLAVSYSQPGRRLEAFRYGEGDAFYDAAGRPLEKMFLRAPLPYSRVTSKFSMRRFHPVLKVARPHYGVDYGAPVGTPVRATANGTVQFAGWDGGGGKTIKIRHANDFLTGYLHLSRFAQGLRAGARVRQGEVIGYVGSTGLSSGPHLDYRVQHRGQWIDPQSLKSVPAEPLSPASRLQFESQREAMRNALAGLAPYAPERSGSPISRPELTANAEPVGSGGSRSPAKK